MGPQSFLDGVSGAPPWRRVAALALCGLVAGVGWWALRRHGRPLVGISRAIEPGGPAMPPAATVIHTLLQIVTVGLGSPLGREVAPREIAAGRLVSAAAGQWQGVVQLGLDGAVPLRLAAALLVLKVFATLACLRAGAAGGLMTPGLTICALISSLLAAGAGALGLQVTPGACAIVGATAFLAASANMPVTAVVLLLEFTQVGHDFLVPMMAATAVAVAVSPGLAARERC